MINIGDSYLILHFINPNDDNNIIEKKENEKNINGIEQKLQIKLFESKKK